MGGSVNNAFAFLVETLFSLYLAALLLRVLLEAVGADYYNPISQVLLKVTEPLVGPLSRVVPRFGRFNTAAVIWMLVLQALAVFLVLTLNGYSLPVPELLVVSVLRLIRLLLTMYLVLILAEVILSWVGGGLRHPIIPLIYQLTRPVLAPIRRVLPSLGGLDLSPLVALIGIQFLMILIGLR
ncbi:YggT family protein [Wenzhouxiangella sp. XN79A]|uniref:YggT family protein n=1 Tax=Wenzhouxiangella sp. XN79A TaxID=2724193 RepID=UPI00144A5874|nr:YggT family protein [Wenzhouxiangella sp. XN79A]NKI35030.1 YggT family protein [Wenzhouxiangella sp. XN79A]